MEKKMVTFPFFPPNLLQWTFETAEIIQCHQWSPGLLAEPKGLSHTPVPGSPLIPVCKRPLAQRTQCACVRAAPATLTALPVPLDEAAAH